MRRLFKYFHSCRKNLILAPFLVFLEVIFEIGIPIFIRRMIDDGIKVGNNDVIFKNGIFMIVFAILGLVFGVLATINASKVSMQFGRNLRQAQYEKIQTYSFENLDKFSTSSLITRMTMDVNMVQNSTNMLIRVAFRAPAMLVFSIVSIALFAGKLTFIFAIVVPILLFGLTIMMMSAHKYFLKMFKKIDRLNLTIQEDLIGIRTVKSYVREDYEIERFTKDALDVSENAKKAERRIIFNNPLMQFSIGLAFILFSYFGSRELVFGSFTEGQFSNVILYINQILFSLMMISQVFLMFTMSKASRERIAEVLDEVPTLTEVENPIMEVRDGSFEFKNVKFKYKQTEDNSVLDGINLKIPSGSLVGVFGATGTGKSTLVQLLARLYDVNDGEIIVAGENVKDYSLSVLRENVILVLQNNVLFSGTVRENMKWGKEDASDEEIIAALKKAQAYDFVSKMPKGLDSWIEQGGVNVSGGQRQRLTIARALIANPKILILDDSTSAVDTKTDANIRKALKEDVKDMTKVVISQRLSSMSDADYIVIMDALGIQAIGTHDELYKNNVMYKEIYDVQAQSKEVD